MKPKIKNKLKGSQTTLARKNDDGAFASYDTSKQETSTPQKVREANESSSEYARQKKAEGK